MDLQEILDEGVSSGAFPGAQGCVVQGDRTVFHGWAGRTAQDGFPGRKVDGETLFDLASLTKVLATTPAVLRLVALGEIRLDDRVTRFWPGFSACFQDGKGEVTVRSLLLHASGLPPWKPLFLEAMASSLFSPALAGLEDAAASGERRGVSSSGRSAAFAFGKELVLRRVMETPLEQRPWTGSRYSDLGFIALGRIVELVTRMDLDDFVREEVHSPLGMPASFAYRPLGKAVGGVAGLDGRSGAMEPVPGAGDGDSGSGEAEDINRGADEIPNIAATGLYRPREPAAGQEGLVRMPSFDHPLPTPVVGQVDDDNAFAMGGVAGHAGMFGTAAQVALFGQRVLEETNGAGRLGPVELWRQFLSRDPRLPGSTRALGFDTPSAQGSSAGGLMAASRTVGHLGFTGTSLWIDLDRELSVALVSNRVHPDRLHPEGIKAIRPAFGDAAAMRWGR